MHRGEKKLPPKCRMKKNGGRVAEMIVSPRSTKDTARHRRATHQTTLHESKLRSTHQCRASEENGLPAAHATLASRVEPKSGSEKRSAAMPTQMGRITSSSSPIVNTCDKDRATNEKWYGKLRDTRPAPYMSTKKYNQRVMQNRGL